MKKWVSTLDLIQNTSSTNTKKEILQTYFDGISDIENDIIYKLFDLQFNYTINSYISDVNKISPKLDQGLFSAINLSETPSEEFFINQIYNKLKDNYRFKKHEYLNVLQNLAKTCKTKEELDFYLKALTRKLVIGMAIAGFNKVIASYPGIPEIEVFECMRAESMKNSRIDYTNAYVSVKKDGVNCTYVKGKFYTRNGGDIILPHMDKEMEEIFKNYAVFGELVSITRQQTAGIVNSALKMGLASTLPVDSLRLHIFDILPLEKYVNKDFYGYTFEDRLKLLKTFSTGTVYEILEHHKVSSLEEVYNWNDFYYKQGEEGVIANDAKQLFELERSKYRVKVKAEHDAEFQIVDYTIHERESNWIGALIVQSKCGKIKTRVGSGFTEKERAETFENIQSIIGKICTVIFNNVDAKNNTLFLPVFKSFREDKIEANTYEEILSIIK